MIYIAIVEDDNEYALTLENFLKKYAQENGLVFSIKYFSNAVAFLHNYESNYDLIFMDIKMPYLNGMDAAHKLREIDQDTLLIFVTSLTQYAVSGYEVDALDYIVKPINYSNFALKMTRTFKRLSKKDFPSELIVSSSEGAVKLKPSEIRYVETRGHQIAYHLKNSEVLQYSSLTSAEKKLKKYDFIKCNSCFLVNLRYVRSIKNYTLNVDGTELQVSQPRRKEVLKRLMAFAEGKDL